MIGKNYFHIFMMVCLVLVGLNGPLRAADLDQRIEAAATNSYVFKNYLKDEDVRVHSRDGIVTLTGTVADENKKSLAQETVGNLNGVKTVDNQLQVKGGVVDKNTDTWLSVQVKGALLFHRAVKAVGTQVFVEKGVVTLRGETNSQAEKDLITEYARDVEGVKDVKNEMTISSAPNAEKTWEEKVDDASIVTQVKMALLLHRSTSAIRTTVQANDGNVTLTGRAKNEAEKELVTKLVKDINGVNHVINNMTVDASI